MSHHRHLYRHVVTTVRLGIAGVLASFATWAASPGRSRPDRGQSTVEYALVLLGAAAVALALVAWVARSDAVSRLFDAIVGRILSRA